MVPSGEIGHYQIESILGKGSSSTVFKAFDPRLSRKVAIKLLHAYEQDDVLQEAKRVASIHDPHVVTIYDVVMYQSQTALVMEYLPGETLADRLASSHPDLKSALSYALEIAKGLHAIHQVGLVHQDVKAENCFFDENQCLKVGDLGIAKPIHQQSPSPMAGSVYSLSPEQIQQTHIGISSDLFSLGVLLYQMLMHRHPFAEQNNSKQTLDNILNSTPAEPKTGYERIDSLVLKLLNKTPEHRPQSAQQVITTIKSVLNTELSPFGNITISQDNPALEAARVKLEYKNKAKSNTRKGLAFVTTFMLLALIAWFVWPPTPRYIAVLDPIVLSGDDHPDIPLIKASINQATIQVIQSLEQNSMVAADEVSPLSGKPANIKQIQQVTAADEVLFTQLDCLTSQCAVTFSLWQGTPAVLVDQQQVQVPTDRLLYISDLIHSFLTPWLDGDKDSRMPASDEQSFRTFLGLKQAFQNNELSLMHYIDSLEALAEGECRYEEICHILLEAYSKQFYRQRDTAWLEKARELVSSAENSTENLTNRMMISIAALEIRAQNFDEADQWLTRLENKYRVDDSVKSLRARWYFSQGIIVKGRNLLSDLIKERPAAKHLFNYALMLFKSGELADASATLDKLFVRVPDHTKGLELYGVLRHYEGDWRGVISTYQQLIAMNQGNNPITQSNIGFAYTMQNDSENALKHLRKAHKLSPSNPQILINLADAESIFGDKQLAFSYYETVIKQISQLPKKTQNDTLTLAQALAHTNKYDEAQLELLKVERDTIEDPYTYYYLCLIYSLLGDTSTASAYKTKALDSGIAITWFDLAWFNLAPNQEE
ncbi:hypothetical protein DXX93_11930 [Thalassotalea euphylliae]|uniref:Protein kinase domain-containing protein n=1 Tax=Thalassotalea euphylliae TaxID=1655234 RepID=A0A3E0TRE8_9GAMM|nr:serine/threonine-protein kinase [Thalassotalea euphylliae]REL27206.1 hypothetical protein DXX93_11930 [Thalassotalea euphylliae]